MEKAKRYNKGKLKYNLIPPIPMEKLAEVYSKGSHKYSIYKDTNGNIIKGADIPYEKQSEYELVESGDKNWTLGLDWGDTIAAVERHIQAWKMGQSVDELGTHPLSNAAWGLFALMQYEYSHPELDSRDLWYKKPFKKLWLDLDGVLLNFEGQLLKWLGLPDDNHPNDWNDPIFRHGYDKIKNNPDFWKSMDSLIDANDIRYPIAGYCTSRSTVDNSITQEVLDRFRFPTAPLINSGHEPKSKFLLEVGCEIMVDDSINNFVDCQSNGISCFLMSRPHNMKYNVGNWRINNLQELFDKLMK